MHDAGTALMGIGTGLGKTSAEDAAIAAISSPLLDAPAPDGAGGSVQMYDRNITVNNRKTL